MKTISYNNLKKTMIDKGMKRKDLLEYFSSRTVSKLWNNEIVSLDILVKLCEILDCDIKDVAGTVALCSDASTAED